MQSDISFNDLKAHNKHSANATSLYYHKANEENEANEKNENAILSNWHHFK